MRYVFPMRLSRADGRFQVRFPDVPEAMTDGADEREAVGEAVDCLVAALGGYVEARRELPRPSRPSRGTRPIALPPLVSAKLALYETMRARRISGVALARRLGLTEAAVRRLLDLDHRSHIGQIETALAALGKRVVVEVQDAA